MHARRREAPGESIARTRLPHAPSAYR
eukprot:COSAG02_NODE_33804_length_494_cov_0.860759_1_plen_26_part_01